MRTVYIGGYECTKYITNIPTIPQGKAERGQLTLNDTISLSGDNTSAFFNQNNVKSIFYGKNITSLRCTIYNNGLQEYNGTISNIKASKRQAEILIRSDFNKIMQQKALYISDTHTPAELCQELLTLYGLATNGSSFRQSTDIHKYYLLYAQVSLTVQSDANLTVLDVVQQLADIGVARLYYYDNEFYYDAYESTYSPPISVALSEKDIATDISTSGTEKEPIERYQITTITNTVSGGVVDSSAMLKQMDYGYDNPIRIISGAAYIGNSYMEISKKNLQTIECGIYKEKGAVIKLDGGFSITYPRFGWADKHFEILSINNSHPFITQIQGLSV